MSLNSRYWGSFITAAAVCLILQLYGRDSSQKTNTVTNARFSSFQQSYLFVFLAAMFADWLQGPYVYELYVSYGFDQVQIAELFVMGFGSSMIVGTFIGGLADKFGRRLLCIAYAVLYTIGCLTKMFPNYWILMFGRFLCGISTSLLFSVFESWMVCEHFKQGFDASLLGETFSYATLGNGVVAVAAGLTANAAADNFGYVSPFMIAIIPLIVIAIVITSSWPENYGNQSSSSLSSLSKGFELIRNDPRIAALGLAQSCFEGAMYTFVFMWTPALKTQAETDAEMKGEALEESTSQFLGVIFAAYMVSVMVGSSIFKIVARNKENIYAIPLVVHASACLAMASVSAFIDNKFIVYSMFLVFETSVGLFYPAYGMIKSEKIPEDIRSAVMNIFRMPLNLFVVVLLLKIKFLSPERVFQVCTGAHFISFVCYYYFYSTMSKGEGAVKDRDANV
jgi:MFS family permease